MHASPAPRAWRERRRRYAVCFNPQEAARQKAHREQLLTELEAELESLRPLPDKEHSKRTCALRASARYGRYLKQTRSGLAIDRTAVKAAERLDGKFVVHSNDDTLSATDMALGYKQLQRVEEAWRSMKSGLNLRPVCVRCSTGNRTASTPMWRSRCWHCCSSAWPSTPARIPATTTSVTI